MSEVEKNEPKKSDDHWFWRRLMAFMSLLSFGYYIHMSGGTDSAVLSAHVFLCAQWALPAFAEKALEIWKGR